MLDICKMLCFINERKHKIMLWNAVGKITQGRIPKRLVFSSYSKSFEILCAKVIITYAFNI